MYLSFEALTESFNSYLYYLISVPTAPHTHTRTHTQDLKAEAIVSILW